MAAEEIEVAPAGKGSKGGIVKTLGIAVGLFVLMLASQLVAPMLACNFMPGLMPGCEQPAPAEEVKKAKDEPKGPPQYLALDPPLVVSFEDRQAIRFLQVTVEVMARDEASIKAVTTHTPVIRNNLLMLMGGRTLSDLTSTEGKELLRTESLSEVQRILKEFDDKNDIEELYFTSFVVQ